MQLVRSIPAPTTSPAPGLHPYLGRHQEMMRAVGAWLDARGFRLVGLTETGDGLSIEVETGGDRVREAFRLDYPALERLMDAARADRDRFS